MVAIIQVPSANFDARIYGYVICYPRINILETKVCFADF